jgi:hypothetical protein
MSTRVPGIDLARLETLLDAYGGDPARWPDAERADALALIAASAAARRLHDEARRLDAVLDVLPVATPSPELEERIVAAARAASSPPGAAVSSGRVHRIDEARRRSDARPGRRLPLLAAAVPLAAAAALALWLAAGRTPQAPPVQHAAPRQEVVEEVRIADLGVYETPSDALLGLAVLDEVYETEPWSGCADSDLGCVQLDTLPLEPVSRGQEVRFYS